MSPSTTSRLGHFCLKCEDPVLLSLDDKGLAANVNSSPAHIAAYSKLFNDGYMHRLIATLGQSHVLQLSVLKPSADMRWS